MGALKKDALEVGTLISRINNALCFFKHKMHSSESECTVHAIISFVILNPHSLLEYCEVNAGKLKPKTLLKWVEALDLFVLWFTLKRPGLGSRAALPESYLSVTVDVKRGLRKDAKKTEGILFPR